MKLTNDRGSFLIEAMISVVIIGSALIALMRAYTAALAAVGIQKSYSRAIVLLNDELDTVIAKGFVDPQAHRSFQKASGGETFDIDFAAQPSEGQKLTRVDIVVRWPAGSAKQRTIAATTCLLPSKGEVHASP